MFVVYVLIERLFNKLDLIIKNWWIIKEFSNELYKFFIVFGRIVFVKLFVNIVINVVIILMEIYNFDFKNVWSCFLFGCCFMLF